MSVQATVASPVLLLLLPEIVLELGLVLELMLELEVLLPAELLLRLWPKVSVAGDPKRVFLPRRAPKTAIITMRPNRIAPRMYHILQYLRIPPP